MKRGRGDFDIRRRRQREIEAIAQHVGAAATEDFDAYLVAWLQALPKSNDRIFAAQNAALRMSGNITENRAAIVVSKARSTAASTGTRWMGASTWPDLPFPPAIGHHHYRVDRCQQAGSKETAQAKGPPAPRSKAPGQGCETAG